jgi:hypothetical protein
LPTPAVPDIAEITTAVAWSTVDGCAPAPGVLRGEESVEFGQFGDAAGEGGYVGGELRRHRPDGARHPDGDRGLAAQDAAVGIGELGTWVHAELVGQPGADHGEHVQRGGRLASAGQGERERGVQRLMQRLVRRGGPQVSSGPRGAAEVGGELRVT